jgi:hypothetical protein
VLRRKNACYISLSICLYAPLSNFIDSCRKWMTMSTMSQMDDNESADLYLQALLSYIDS